MIPILVAGISNIAVGVFWLAMTLALCFTFLIGIPMIVLGVFEILFYTDAKRKSLQEILGRSKTYAVLEIIAGMFNWISFVCGIVVLVNRGKH